MAREASTVERDLLVKEYMQYVTSIAIDVSKRLASWVDLDDLISYGRLGLVQAAERFDPAAGVNFKTFSYYRIRGAIFDGLRELGWISRSHYSKLKFEEQANEYLSQQATSTVGRHQVDNGEDANQLYDMISGLVPIYILSIEGMESISRKLAGGKTPDEMLDNAEQHSLITELVNSLTEQERILIRMYYFEDKTLQEIGEVINLSKSWVSRLHAKIIRKLRDALMKRGYNP